MPRGAGVTTRISKPVPVQTTQAKSAVPSPGLFSRNVAKMQPTNTSEDACRRQSSVTAAEHVQQGPDKSVAVSGSHPGVQNSLTRPAYINALSSQLVGRDNGFDEASMKTLSHLELDEDQSRDPSIYSRDSSDTYPRDSASIYSSNSSTYSQAASMYKTEDSTMSELNQYPPNSSTNIKVTETDITITSGSSGEVQYHESVHSTTTVRRTEPPQDDASQERSALARKAALFKNSRLPPRLPTFKASLLQWSLICRAAQASSECYGPLSHTRRGIYTAADTSKHTKAVTVDEQTIDGSQFVIVAIRGTAFGSLTDWSTNKAGKLTSPIGFLDDEENACHDGFLQVSRAMIAMIAAQLQDHPAMANKPALLLTGHSAGGAVATMLYCHMLSTKLSSVLSALKGQFASINCVTFGAPPVSLTAIPPLDPCGGMFLTFVNEGDPVSRISNTAYVKSLVQLMTASSNVAAPAPNKLAYRSRGGAAVYKPAPALPWEELPLWPTPAATFMLAGNIVLLRDGKTGVAEASTVTCEDLKDVIFGDLDQHSCLMYIRCVKEAALSAMTGMTLE